jgi:hypothetical protein
MAALRGSRRANAKNPEILAFGIDKVFTLLDQPFIRLTIRSVYQRFGGLAIRELVI